MRFVIFAIVCTLFSFPATAQELAQWTEHGLDWRTGCSESATYCYITIDYRHDQRPTGLFEKIGECANDDICKSFLKAAITAAGAPETAANLAVESVGFAADVMRQNGEGMKSTYRVPRGYVICNVRWKLWSNTSNSSMGVRMHKQRLDVSSYARKNNLGGPGEWVKAFVEITAVKSSEFKDLSADKKCVAADRYGASFLLYDKKHKGVPVGRAIAARIFDKQ